MPSAMPRNVLVELGYRAGSKRYHIGDGFFYHVNRRCITGLSLRCMNYYSLRCYGRATCSNDLSLSSFRLSKPHRRSCVPNRSLPKVWELRRKILHRCLSKDATRFSKIVRQTSKGYSRKARSENHHVRLRSAMWRARTRFFPPVPQDLSELHRVLSSDRWRHLTLTNDGRSYLYAGRCGSSQNRTRCLIFMSSAMKMTLKGSKKIFCDSTWDGRPTKPKCSQIFSMTTTHNHQIIPLCITLMESKTTKTYIGLFEAVMTLVPEFDPNEFHCDFEIAQYKAILEKWPTASVAGCLYHFSARVSEKAKKLQLTRLINDCRVFKSITRSCLAIPLVPQNDLERALESLMLRAHSVLYYEPLEPLFKYLWEEWIQKRNHVLSVNGYDDRTSNVSESFNHSLQQYSEEKHPNVFLFINALLEIEDDAKQNMYNMRLGLTTSRSRRKSAVRNDHAILRLDGLRREGSITMSQFLRSASYRIQAPFKRNFPEDEIEDEDEDNPDDPPTV